MGAKAEAVEHGAAAAAVLVSGVERLVRCLGGSVMFRSTALRLFYGFSYRFHLSGDNSRDRAVALCAFGGICYLDCCGDVLVDAEDGRPCL